ncbi:hypothetical protein F4775DRAFT_215897 [Biscogniauxia sp. FL1348]|nr:hypothetical protein F4775DRAFT_215897 [Biscogniauxia sp. FL1348]
MRVNSFWVQAGLFFSSLLGEGFFLFFSFLSHQTPLTCIAALVRDYAECGSVFFFSRFLPFLFPLLQVPLSSCPIALRRESAYTLPNALGIVSREGPGDLGFNAKTMEESGGL